MSQYSEYNNSYHSNGSQLKPSFIGATKTGVGSIVDDYENMTKNSYSSDSNSRLGRVSKNMLTVEEHRARQKNKPPTIKLPGSITKEILDASLAYTPEDAVDELEIASDTYPQIDLIPIQMTALPNNMWDFCVAYCSAAMSRRAQPRETIDLLNGQPVGLYYLAALTLFYSLEEAALGRIPPIQMMSPQLAELLYEVAPINRKGKAYTPIFDNDILSLIQSRPYHAYENPNISIAPHTGLILPSGLPQVANTIPSITLADINEQGPLAFEKVQRYFLGSENPKLVPYTPGSGSSSGAMFAAYRDYNSNSPIRGVSQVVNEVSLPQRDYMWTSLAFFAPSESREGWSTRTVQRGTHLAIVYLMTGKVFKKCITHMINLATINADVLANFIVAEVNSNVDFTMDDLAQAAPFDPGFLSQMTPGQLLNSVLAIASRRFWLSSASCAGTPMMARGVEVIGAGTHFITDFQVDTVMSFQTCNEQLADLSRFEDNTGVLHLPVLVMRGSKQATNYWFSGTESILENLRALYPQAGATSYNMKAPGTNGLPNILDIDTAQSVCWTLGPAIDVALRVFSSTASSLQGNNAISVGTDGRDGTGSRSCFITHYISFPPNFDPSGVDTTPIQNVQFILSRQRFNGKTISTQLNHLFPVMYEQYNPNTGTSFRTSLPAFQTLTYSTHAAAVDIDYYDMRASTCVASGHKLAANALMPSGLPLYYSHRIMLDEGGNFVDSFFRNGKWVDTASLISKGIMNLVAPELADSVSKMVSKGGKALHGLVTGNGKKGSLSALHLAPVTNGFISQHKYLNHVDELEKLIESGEYRSVFRNVSSGGQKRLTSRRNTNKSNAKNRGGGKRKKRS